MKQQHFVSITEPNTIGGLWCAIAGYRGSFVAKCILKLAPLVVVLPGELRKAAWAEFNLNTAEWRIPGARMKKDRLHIVQLATQVVALLRELQPLTGSGRYVCPRPGQASGR